MVMKKDYQIPFQERLRPRSREWEGPETVLTVLGGIGPVGSVVLKSKQESPIINNYCFLYLRVRASPITPFQFMPKAKS